MKKLLSFLILMIVCVGQAFAYSFKVGNIYYNKVGTNSASVTFGTSSYNSYSGNVSIPSSVTYNGKTYSVIEIGNNAFYNSTDLLSVDIPSSVKSIKYSAFEYCTNLSSVTIANGLTSIREYAFQYCSSLDSISLPNSVTEIKYGAFGYCRNLSSITIPNSVTSIESETFIHSGLTSITIPNSVTSIGTQAFSGCRGLTSVTIPNSVKSIGNYAFENCPGLTSVTIPNGVTSIGDGAFKDCSGLASVTIPNSVTSMGVYAFSGCSGLISVSIPNSLTSIAESAFSGCSGLTSITIPDSVTSIEYGAFHYCSGLTSITIPISVTSIGNSAFGYCSSLTSITVASGNKSYDSRDNCNAIIETASNTLIAGCKNTVIPNNVTSIGDYAFKGCSGLTSVTIPNSVTSIGNYAFYYCSKLSAITIPSSVTSIGNYAFNQIRDIANNITNLATVPQTISSKTFSKYGTLHVRKGYKDVYAAKEYWKNFTIVDDAIFSATLADGEEYISSMDTDYDEVIYTRTFNNTDWQALYVPFALDYNEWKDYFDIAEISTYAQYDDNADGDYDRMNLVVEKLEAGSTLANHPYLIRAKSTGTKTLALTNKTLKAAEVNSMTCTSALGNYELTITGTYTEKTDMFANGYYALSGGRLMQANSASVVLKPQRWYIDAKTLGSGVKAWKIVVEEAEGIKTPSTSPGESPVAYDLMGRGVKAGAKGISIVNGKKIIR